MKNRSPLLNKHFWATHAALLTVGFFICLFLPFNTFAQRETKSSPATILKLEIPGLPSNPADIDWERLPLLSGERITLFKGEENKTAFNHYPTIFYFQDRFFASWGNGDKDEDFSGQRILYATSQDGHKWSAPVNMTGSVPGRAYITGGYWVYKGELFALAYMRDSRRSSLNSDNNLLTAYRWNRRSQTFDYAGPVAENIFAMEGPRLTADGDWLMLGRPGPKAVSPDRTTQFARGGRKTMDTWLIKSLPNEEIAHDVSWYALPDGNLILIEAVGEVPDRRLVSMVSSDHGNSWSKPAASNFPDADSRLYGVKLSNGLYVLLNNPNPSRYRIPLTIALSADGLRFDRMANVRIEQTNKKFTGESKAPGYQYVRAFEHAHSLWIIYSVNKEDIEITKISLRDIETFYAEDQCYVGKAGKEMIIDNGTDGFLTHPSWSVDTSAGVFKGVRMGYHGNNYAYILDSSASPGAWARWSPKIDRRDSFAVYIRWTTKGFGSKSMMPDIVPIEIRHAAGTYKSSVDQSRYGGTWIYLGTFELNPHAESFVKIYAVKNRTTVADAVKFLLIE